MTTHITINTRKKTIYIFRIYDTSKKATVSNTSYKTNILKKNLLRKKLKYTTQ
jgi:hypothetical protein